MAVADPFGLIGQIIDGQVRVESVIGEGGFSIVYKGEHLGLGEPVAIKCLKLPRKLDPKLADAFGKRFRDEGRLLYRLSQGSLYIVRSITSGTCIAPSSGVLVPEMALEWLVGHSLVQEFRERRARGKTPLSIDEAIKLFDPAVQALAYAHSQGVVHRDVKPGNLFYTQTREGPKLKVLDFGLAKIFNDEAIGMQPSVKTAGNFFMCSPSYGAPEQFDPRIGEVGPWTDVYATALVFAEALADRKARHADSMAEGAILALNPATRPTPRSLGVNVPDAVERVLARAVSLKPQDRQGDCGELWGALKNAILSSPPVADLAQTTADDPQVVAARLQVAQAIAARDVAPAERPPSTMRMSEPSVPPAAGAPLAMPAPRAENWASTAVMDQAPPKWQGMRAPASAPPAATNQAYGPSLEPMRAAARSFDEASHGATRKPSRAPMIALVAFLILALMGVVAWGTYIWVKRRALPPRVGVGVEERTCPSFPT